SIRDGWWDELYDGWNGWAIPSADEVVDAERRDDFEASAIYDLLEHEVRPLFYDRVDGIPKRWIAMVKHSIESLGPALLASRMVSAYTALMYRPAARSSRELAASGFAGAHELAEWKARVGAAWQAVAVRGVEFADGAFHAGDQHGVRVRVQLGQLRP